jgi:hypothetical protein
MVDWAVTYQSLDRTWCFLRPRRSCENVRKKSEEWEMKGRSVEWGRRRNSNGEIYLQSRSEREAKAPHP